MPRKDLDLDLSSLYEISITKPQEKEAATQTRYKFAEVSNRFQKVAFDMFSDKQGEFLWKLEKDADTGEEFIIRTASKDPSKKQIKTAWSAQSNQNKTAITMFYKGQAVTAFNKSDVGFDESNVEDWQGFLSKKASTDPQFIKEILKKAGTARLDSLKAKFPELAEYLK